MKIKPLLLGIAFIGLGITGFTSLQSNTKNVDSKTEGNTACEIYGKIKIVEYGEDYKVKIVDYGEDVKIKWVEYGEDNKGKWKEVEYGEDFKIKWVEYGEDFKVKEVEYGEGC